MLTHRGRFGSNQGFGVKQLGTPTKLFGQEL